MKTALPHLAPIVCAIALAASAAIGQQPPEKCAWGADVNPGAGPKLAESVERELLTFLHSPAKERPARAAALARKRAVDAIEAWKRFRNPEFVELAHACLDHPDWHVVHRGLHWARALHDPELLERAWPLLERAEPRLREKAAITCLETWDAAAAPRLAGGRAKEALFVLRTSERDPVVAQALDALQRRIDGTLALQQLCNELQVTRRDGLIWTPFVRGLKQLDELAQGTAPASTSDVGGASAAQFAPAAKWGAPLVGYGEEEVPRIVLQPFGNPRKEGALFHTGQDVGGCFDGAGIYALADGVVRWTTSGSDMGVAIVVEHLKAPGELVNAVCMHAGSTLFVRAGDAVKAGQLLGTVGLSYSAENGGQFAHLHLGLYPGPFRLDHNYGYRPASEGLDDWLDPSVVLPQWIAASASRGTRRTEPQHLFVPAGRPVRQPGDEEEAAQAQLEAAEELARRGKCELAAQKYRALAKEHPDTKAGRAAARRATPSAYLGWADVVRHGPSENRCDVVILGDGYTLDHQQLLENLAVAIPPVFEAQPEFREYWNWFNFERGIVVSKDDGVDEYGRTYDTIFDGKRGDGIQGQVEIDHGRVMAVLREMPCADRLAVVFVKLGVLGTGGGGVATIGGRDMSTLIHEFGHAFADLGDEYSSNTGERGAVQNSPNVSNTADPKQVPWRHWIEARVPGIGVYEGANGQPKGAWKPSSKGCVMSSGNFYCPPCREALVLALYDHVDPIDGCTPLAQPFDTEESLPTAASYAFEVTVLRPASHALDVRWWILPESAAPPAPASWENGSLGRDRSERGRLATIEAEPAESDLHRDATRHAFTVDPKKLALAPGRWRVICRVRDDPRPRGERWPWVVKDEQGLLESERSWWIRVEAPPSR